MENRTLRLAVDPLHPERGEKAIEHAAAILRAGGTVAFATETVYGLGANALDPAAIEKIFIAKQRPAWDPLIVHIADTAMLPTVAAQVPEPARVWMERFWPGPLTLLLPRTSAVPDAVTAGRPRVAVRMPRHPVAQALLRAAGIPIAAPSANLFGHVSPTTAAHVLADLDGRIDAVLASFEACFEACFEASFEQDGGSTEHGLESTVVDACEDPCLVYRPGTVTLEQLAAVWPRVAMYKAIANSCGGEPQALPSPGVGLRHYAPRARLVLVEHGAAQARELIRVAMSCVGEKTGILLPHGLLSTEQQSGLPADAQVYAWGDWSRPTQLAQRLFAGLRALDAVGVKRIVCPLPPAQGIGLALCDRLRKAAQPR